MRIGVFSDVHGNLSALKAVLKHMDETHTLDQIVFAGDLCLVGPRPMQCLELVAQREIQCIVGNTDEWIRTPPAVGDDLDEPQRQRLLDLRALCDWTLSQLDEPAIGWLDKLLPSFEYRIKPPKSADDELLIVHANPHDLTRVIFPSLEKQMELYGRIRQSDDDLADLLRGLAVRIIGFGHLHVPGVRQCQDTTLVNVSSVSLPGDGDARAKYAVLTWQSAGGWTVEHQYVPYPVEEELEAYHRLKPPGWQKHVESIRVNGFSAQVV